MVEAATRDHGGVASFSVGDLRAWTAPDGGVDVLVSNATLQWVPDHLDLLPSLVAQVAPGGWLAFQVPGNFHEPSHTLRAELAAESPYAEHSPDAGIHGSEEPAAYLDALAAAGCAVDVWETTYLHVLQGEDPVFAWVSGTGARPTIQSLPEGGVREQFVAEFKRRLRAAYPPQAVRRRAALPPHLRRRARVREPRMRLHHVQVAMPRGAEADARRFYARRARPDRGGEARRPCRPGAARGSARTTPTAP